MIRKSILYFTLSIIIISMCSCGIINSRINRTNMLNLKIGMSKSQVLSLMGNPYKSEAYQVEDKNLEFWLYRTTFGEGSHNYTPLAFENDTLIGWGLNYYDNALRIKQDIKIEKR